MDGSSFGKYFGEALVKAAVICALGGAVVGIGLWVLVPWLFWHVSLAVR